MSLLQVLHFKHRYKQTLSYGLFAQPTASTTSQGPACYSPPLLWRESALQAEEDEIMGKMERGGADEGDMRHSERGKQRHKEQDKSHEKLEKTCSKLLLCTF